MSNNYSFTHEAVQQWKAMNWEGTAGEMFYCQCSYYGGYETFSSVTCGDNGHMCFALTHTWQCLHHENFGIGERLLIIHGANQHLCVSVWFNGRVVQQHSWTQCVVRLDFIVSLFFGQYLIWTCRSTCYSRRCILCFNSLICVCLKSMFLNCYKDFLIVSAELFK